MSIRYDWYQTETKVVVDVLVKNAKDRNTQVDFVDNTINVTVDDCSLKICLSHAVKPESFSFQMTPSKIEMTLLKSANIRWTTLDKVDSKKTCSSVINDWDRIAKEIAAEKEEPEGEEAVQGLFRRIYDESSDEVKRAMNKSFSESGGTVLSTNWKDVGGKTVQAKPPDGTEYRTWDN